MTSLNRDLPFERHCCHHEVAFIAGFFFFMLVRKGETDKGRNNSLKMKK
jgi:hypothetical protein